MSKNNKSANCASKLGSIVTKSDAFGTPVSLTYKKETCIKSFLGGFVTCLARLGVVVYLLIQCINVLNR